MREQRDVIVERVADAGRWFEPGARAEYFPVEHDPRLMALEPAALGSYEVVGGHRVKADARRWLDVRLRRLYDA
jgi:hypothetical protein